ncbi:MAG: NADPH-Fe(3+) oxidoreductase subunit alpha [Chloroflexi bacterium]|nr:NADPH-Fe(3+) oxidoreductase subunit alpha [Chloroflexota bacterium]
MDQFTFTIDGQTITAEDGMSIMDAALANDIYIPYLCHHPDLEPVGACRLCGVEVDGRPMVMSCMTPAKEGTDVRTNSPAIYQARKVAMELLIMDHDMDCLACEAADDCDLLKVSAYLGIQPEQLEGLRPLGRQLPIDDSNPYFQFDPNKCILCGICVRTCNEIVGLGALGYINRGIETVVGTFGDKGFVDSICESCGECVVRCPVGSLAPKKPQLAAREISTICAYCGVGCGIHFGVRGDEIVSTRADRESPANRGSLCVKGRYGFNFINHPDRLTTPLIKKDGQFVESSWEEAITLVADKLSNYHGEEFAALTSAKCTNEDNYVVQKFTRAVMGTNTIDHCARL